MIGRCQRYIKYTDAKSLNIERPHHISGPYFAIRNGHGILQLDLFLGLI